MIHTDLEKAASFPTPSVALQVSALQASAPIVLALAECDEELRAEAIELFKQLASGELDEEQRFATVALLAEILFPNADSRGAPGLDLVEAETIASSTDPEAKDILARMDKEESFFADRLRDLMAAKGLTQAGLAAKVSIGQPAISMMLNRVCRPQRKTVLRFAEALGVPPEQLWPQVRSQQAAPAPEPSRSAVGETGFPALSRCSEEQIMNREDEDPDWEAEAEAAEAAERRAEFLKNVAECMGRIQAAHCLDLTSLPLGTRLVINTFGEFDPPIEITILEPASCKVSIKEQNGIAGCIEGILLGCEDLEAITPGKPFPSKRVLLPGKLKLLCWLVYEVNGKRVDARSNTIRTIEILQPGMEKPFVLWAND